MTTAQQAWARFEAARNSALTKFLTNTAAARAEFDVAVRRAWSPVPIPGATLQEQARDAYYIATAPARAVFDDAVSQARAVYDAACSLEALEPDTDAEPD